MTKKPADFVQAFVSLTTELSKQATGSQIISFDRAIQEPFEATYAPISSHALHELGRVFSGDDNRSLFLRLDGPAIYLIVVTVLQFPPCSMLSKIVFFFTDVLKLYIDSRDAHGMLDTHSGENFTQRELAKRQKTIFSQLIPRLKALLFDDEKHHKVRRLIAQLIVELCQKNAQGWKVLMEAQAQLLFGNLFSHVRDYVLRIFISDILRHLLANNYEVHELWSTSSEEIMGFSASQELDTETISKILHSMSALDAATAFREEGHSRLYHVSDVNISGLQYHSARSDTIIVVDDQMTLLVPCGGRNGAFFAAYEAPITQAMYLENQQTTEKQTSYVKICWRDHQGYVALRGRKERVGEIRLQFSQRNAQKEFCDAFDKAFERQVQHNWSSQPQQTPQTTQQLQSIVVDDPAMHDANGDTRPRSNAADCRTKDLANNAPLSVENGSAVHISSDSIIQDLEIPSDVFAFPGNNGGSGRSTILLQKLSQAMTEGPILQSLATPNGSRDGEVIQMEARSSPLKTHGRCMEEKEATVDSQIPARNPALSGPFDQENDPDFVGFLMTASRVNAARPTCSSKEPAHHRPIREAQGPEAPQKDPSYTKANRVRHEVNSTTANSSSLKRPMRIDKAPIAPRKRSKTMSSDVSSNIPVALVQNPQPAMAPTNEPKAALKPGASRARKALSSGRSKSTITNDVDWDKDLRTDAAETKEQNAENKRAVQPPQRRPLKDTTNTVQSPKAAAQNKVRNGRMNTAKPRRAPPARSASPVRRSQRTATSKARSYAESLTSEDEGLQEKDVFRRPLIKNIRSSEKLNVQETNKARKSKMVLSNTRSSLDSRTLTKTADHDQRDETVIVLASSDDDDESKSAASMKSVPHPSDLVRGGTAPNADMQADEEVEVLDDSHPLHDTGPHLPPNDSDRSFGTKLSGLIAISAVMPDRDNMQRAMSTPFGNSKHFIHNANAAKRISSPAKKTSPSIPLQLAAGVNHSAGTENNGMAKVQNGLPKRTEHEQGTSIRDRVAADFHCASDTSEEHDRNGKSKPIIAPGQDHIVQPVETEETGDRERSSSLHGNVKMNAPQPLQSPGELSKQGGSPCDTDRASAKISSLGKDRDAEATDTSRSADRPQNVQKTASRTPRILASRTTSLKSIKRNIATPSRLRSAAGSSKSQMVHFGNSGPSLPEQKPVHKAIIPQIPQDEQHPQKSDTASEHEGQKKQLSSAHFNSWGNCRLPSNNAVLQDSDINDSDTLPTRADLGYQRTHSVEEEEDDDDDSCDFAGDADSVQVSEEPVAPSNLEPDVIESNGFNRRSDHGSKLHQTLSTAQPATNNRTMAGPSSTPHADDQLMQLASRENTEVLSACISSVDVPMVITGNPDNANCIAPSIQSNSRESRTDITEFRKPASPGTTQQETKSESTEDQAGIRTSKHRIPTISGVRLPQTGDSKQFGKAFHCERTPLLPMSTIARNIFSNKNKQEIASTSAPTKNSKQIETSKRLSNSLTVTQAAEPSVAADNSSSTRTREQARLVPERFPPKVPIQSHKERAINGSTPSPVLRLENTSGDREQQATYAPPQSLNIRRVTRQNPSPVQDSSTLVLSLGTPQAFLQQLHAPTSPLIAIKSSIDFPDSPKERSQFVQMEGIDKHQPYRHETIPLPVRTTKREAPSSLTSSEAEEDQSMLPRTWRTHPHTERSTSNFASMVEGNMLEVIWNLADRIDAQERTIAEQIEAYHTGSVDLVEDLKRNSSARINHDASKLGFALRERRQDTAEAKAQLAKIVPPCAESDQACHPIEQYKQHLYAMLDDVRP